MPSIPLPEPDLDEPARLPSGPTRTYFGGFDRRPSRGEVQTYMRGDCAYFALALHALTGHQIMHFGDHFAVRDPEGNYWDVRGRMSATEVMDGLGKVVPDPVGPDAVKAELETGLWSDGPLLPSRLQKTRKLVRELMASRLPPPRPGRVEWSVAMLDDLAARTPEEFAAFHRERNASEKATRKQIDELARRRAGHPAGR